VSDISRIGDLPVCPGCGLVSHITHGDICSECFARREGWLGGGGIRVVPDDGDVHETPLCPDFDGGIWAHWRDEDALYYTMSPDTEAGYCDTCKDHRLTGFSNGEEVVDA
jgi:hypothetical protein